MEISQLEYFVILARIKNFTKAAHSVAITQSALSHSIGKLERELNVSLFDRTERGVFLTTAGEYFLAHAEKVLNELKKGQQELKEMNDPQKGLVHLSFIHSLGVDLIPALIAGYGQIHRHVRFVLTQNNSTILTKELLEGKNDMCLCPPLMNMENIIWVYLYSEELYAAVPKSHRLATRKSLTMRDLAGEAFISLKRSYNLRLLTEQFMAQAGVAPNIIYEGDDVHTLAGLIASKMGVSILPKIGTMAIPNVVFIPFTGVACKREIGLAWNSAAEMPPAANAFRKYILDYFTNDSRKLGKAILPLQEKQH
ncbi:MAG: LysR family transcriptional regulator [Phascolarctobacterium sp.]